MTTSEFLIKLSPASVFLLISVTAQICLLVYASAYSSKTAVKKAFTRWLITWTCYNLSMAVGETYMTTFDTPRGIRAPTEIRFEQIWMSFAAFLGPTGVHFFFHLMKHKQTLLIRTIFILATCVLICGWIFPDLSDRNGPFPSQMSIALAGIPWIYSICWMLYYKVWSNDPSIKRRLGPILLSLTISLSVFLPFTTLNALGILTEVPLAFRHFLTMFITLQTTTLFTLAITKYGAFEVSIEEAAEELFAHIKDPVLILDNLDQVTRINPAAKTSLQLQHMNIERHIAHLLPSFDTTLSRSEISLDIKNENIVYLCSLVDIHTEEDKLGKLLVMRDITEEKRVVEMKNAFMTSVSHELRTPLTSVLGFTKLIQKKWAQLIVPNFPITSNKEKRVLKQVAKNLDIIVSESERLTALINNVLDINKMESGAIEWEFREVMVREIIEQSIAATQGLFSTKNLPLNLDLQDADIMVVADKNRLVQVMLNLISNAVKFTKEGSIDIRVRKRPDDILVAVQDSGMGMPPESVGKVFEKYQQVGKSSESIQKGTGLGLPISKEIVEGHGGKIWAESTYGEGSTFFFTIPFSPNPTAVT